MLLPSSTVCSTPYTLRGLPFYFLTTSTEFEFQGHTTLSQLLLVHSRHFFSIVCSCVRVKKDHFIALGKNSPCFQNSSVCFLVTFSKWRCLQLPHYSQKQLPSVIQSDRTGTGLQCQGAPSRESRKAANKQTGVLGLSPAQAHLQGIQAQFPLVGL